jgi:hypothetical protein
MLTSVFLAGRMKCGKDTVAEQLAGEYGYVVVGLADALKRMTALLFEMDDTAFWGSSDQRNAPLAVPITEERVGEAARALAYKADLLPVHRLFKNKRLRFDVATQLWNVLRPITPITSARVLLQRMGTEFGRGLWEDVWIEEVERVRTQVALGVPYFRRDGLLSELKTRLAPAPIVVPDCRFLNEVKYAHQNSPVYWVDAARRIQPDPRFAHASEPQREDLDPYITASIDNNGTLVDLRLQVRNLMLQHAK